MFLSITSLTQYLQRPILNAIVNLCTTLECLSANWWNIYIGCPMIVFFIMIMKYVIYASNISQQINRNKNKWKFNFKDGIMNLNGRDYVFQKATGEAEWWYRISQPDWMCACAVVCPSEISIVHSSHQEILVCLCIVWVITRVENVCLSCECWCVLCKGQFLYIYI